MTANWKPDVYKKAGIDPDAEDEDDDDAEANPESPAEDEGECCS